MKELLNDKLRADKLNWSEVATPQFYGRLGFLLGELG